MNIIYLFLSFLTTLNYLITGPFSELRHNKLGSIQSIHSILLLNFLLLFLLNKPEESGHFFFIIILFFLGFFGCIFTYLKVKSNFSIQNHNIFDYKKGFKSVLNYINRLYSPTTSICLI